MRLGVLVLQASPWAQLAEEFRAVEQVGYDVVYVADHLTHPTMSGQWLADPWTTLAAAASVTSRIELGTLVASAAFRTPVTLARLAATANDISGGRLVLGLGAGTSHCVTADRGERPSPREMGDRFADMVAGLVHVWAGEQRWDGEFLGYDGAQSLSRPEGQAPPFLLLAAHGPRAIDLVARHGDGWSTYGGPAATSLDETAFWDAVGSQSARVDEACLRHDRDPRALRRSLLLGYGAVRPLESVAAFVACAERAAEVGFDELVVYWPFGVPGSRFWSDRAVHAEGVREVRTGLS